jgi:hypothetical protein
MWFEPRKWRLGTAQQILIFDCACVENDAARFLFAWPALSMFELLKEQIRLQTIHIYIMPYIYIINHILYAICMYIYMYMYICIYIIYIMEWNGMKDDIFEPPFIQTSPVNWDQPSEIAKIIINMLDKSTINTIYKITIVPIELINIMLNG